MVPEALRAGCDLDRRYRLGLRSRWWKDEIQIELLAALGAWLGMFDYANWTDPEGKARLLFQLPSVRELVRGGAQQFNPDRERGAFERHLARTSAAGTPTMFAGKHDHSDDPEGLGEHSGSTDELHVSHAVAYDPQTGLMLYSALIVLRPNFQ